MFKKITTKFVKNITDTAKEQVSDSVGKQISGAIGLFIIAYAILSFVDTNKKENKDAKIIIINNYYK